MLEMRLKIESNWLLKAKTTEVSVIITCLREREGVQSSPALGFANQKRLLLTTQKKFCAPGPQFRLLLYRFQACKEYV
jgi:hypothetical protein